MSTGTEIVRTLAPFFDAHIIGVAMEQKTLAKRQEYLSNNVCKNPVAALEAASERFRRDSKLTNKNLAENLGISVTQEFLVNITREIGKRFTRCVNLLEQGRDAIDYARAWCNREQVLRDIINEEIALVREQQKARRQAVKITNEVDRFTALTETLKTSLRTIVSEEVEKAIEPLLVEEDSDEEDSQDGGSDEDEEDSQEEEESSQEEEEDEEEEIVLPPPSKSRSHRAAAAEKPTEKPTEKSTERSSATTERSRATTEKPSAATEKSAVSSRISSSSSSYVSSHVSSHKPSSSRKMGLNISGLQREESVKESTPQEWVGKNQVSAKGKSTK